MATTYPVKCTCGVVQQVTATRAGSRLPCTCGSVVEVPSLVRLKASAGEESVSADFEIEGLIHQKALPLEKDCCQCHAPTNHTRNAVVECETTSLTTQKSKTAAGLFANVGLFGWFAFGRDQHTTVHGRILNLKLPIRICETCSENLQTEADCRQSLMQSELYSRLLIKYPKAKIKLLP